MKYLMAIMLVGFSVFSNAGIITHNNWKTDGTIVNYTGANKILSNKEWLSWSLTDEMSIEQVLESNLVLKDGWNIARSDLLSVAFNDFFDSTQFNEDTGKGDKLAITDELAVTFTTIFGATFQSDSFVNNLSTSAAWSYNAAGTKLFAATVRSEYQVENYTPYNSAWGYVRDYSLRASQFDSMSPEFGVALVRDIAPPMSVSEPTGMGIALLAAFPFLLRMRRSRK
jgi:hypothetical protein